MKLHLPKALAAAVMALFAIPNALAETVTVTIDGTQYAGTTVLTAETTSEPTEGDYVLFNTGRDSFYSIQGTNSDWIYSTTKTLIGAPCVDSNGTNYTGGRLFFDTGNNGTMTVKANLIVGSDGSEDDLRFWSQPDGSSFIILKGSISLVNTTTQIWNQNGTQYLEGVINGAGKTLKTVGTTSTALLRLSGGGTIGTLNLAQAGGSVTLSATNQVGTAANGLEYTITTMASGNSTAALTVESGVTLHLTNLNAGKLVNGGTLNLTDYNAGTLSNTGTVNLTNFNGGTLTNEGTLNLTNYKRGTLTNTGTVKFATSSSLGTMLSVGGTLDLSAITTLNVDAADSKNFTRLGSLPTSNGYYKGDVALIGYSGNEEVSIGSITGTGWLDGATITYDSTNKRLTASIVADFGVYCVVTDTNTTDNTALSAEATSLIALGNSAVLGLNAGWNDLKGIDSSGGTINIASGASLSSANLRATAATELNGAGQYIISSPGAAISNLGSNVSLADSWTGVVTVSGGSGGSSLSNLAKGGKSTIEFKGFSGYDNVSDAWKGTMAYNVKLTNVGNAVAWSNGAWASSENTGVFTGKWSGTGTFFANVASDKYQNYKYTGDISEWTGEFRLNNGTTNLTFSDSATTVNAAIGKNGGTLNLIAGANIAFNKSVNVSSISSADYKLTMSSGSVSGTATIGGLTKIGGDQLMFQGSTTLTGTTSVEGGTLRFGNMSDSSEGVTVQTFSVDKLSISSGAKVCLNYTKGTMTSLELNGGTLWYRDSVTKGTDVFSITTLSVSQDSSLQKNFKGIMNVTTLTGSANLAISNETNHSYVDIFDLNVSTLKDYHGTISSTADKFAFTVSAANQAEGKVATISSAVTLVDGFTKSGKGELALTGTATLTGATISEGTVKFAGSSTTLNGILGITGGVFENSSTETGDAGMLSLGSDGKIQISNEGSFVSNGFTYTVNQTGATITGNGASKLSVNSGAVSVADAVMEKTGTADDEIGVQLTDVVLKARDNTGTTTLSGDKQQTLSKVTVGSGSTVKMENTHTDSSIALVEGGGRFETNRDFTGTLAGGAGATLTAKLAGTTQTGTVVKVDASVGSVNLLNTSSVTVTDMVIGAGKTVGVYTGDSAVTNPSSSDEGSVTLTKLKVDGTGATLNANLTLGEGAGMSFNVAGLTGATGESAICTLKGSLTLGSNVELHLLNLGILEEGKSITLFTGVTDFTYSGATPVATLSDDDISTGVDASQIFGNVDSGFFTVKFVGNDVILTASSTVPEPTTATLSLLALMGLAARRRRKAAK